MIGYYIIFNYLFKVEKNKFNDILIILKKRIIMFKKITFILLCSVLSQASADYLIKFENNQMANNIPDAPEIESYSSCKEILESDNNANNGDYTITLNEDDVSVECDMTTNGGGWTKIVSNGSSLNTMKIFGETAEIEDTFYFNSEFGVGWGKNDNIEKSYFIDENFSFNEVYIQYSGSYNTPAGGLGYFYVRDNGDNVISLGDGHTNSASGQSLKVNDVVIFSQEQVNVVDRIDILNRKINEITMKGFTSSYPYTKRYIKNLWLR